MILVAFGTCLVHTPNNTLRYRPQHLRITEEDFNVNFHGSGLYYLPRSVRIKKLHLGSLRRLIKARRLQKAELRPSALGFRRLRPRITFFRNSHPNKLFKRSFLGLVQIFYGRFAQRKITCVNKQRSFAKPELKKLLFYLIHDCFFLVLITIMSFVFAGLKKINPGPSQKKSQL